MFLNKCDDIFLCLRSCNDVEMYPECERLRLNFREALAFEIELPECSSEEIGIEVIDDMQFLTTLFGELYCKIQRPVVIYSLFAIHPIHNRS